MFTLSHFKTHCIFIFYENHLSLAVNLFLGHYLKIQFNQSYSIKGNHKATKSFFYPKIICRPSFTHQKWCIFVIVKYEVPWQISLHFIQEIQLYSTFLRNVGVIRISSVLNQQRMIELIKWFLLGQKSFFYLKSNASCNLIHKV